MSFDHSPFLNSTTFKWSHVSVVSACCDSFILFSKSKRFCRRIHVKHSTTARINFLIRVDEQTVSWQTLDKLYPTMCSDPWLAVAPVLLPASPESQVSASICVKPQLLISLLPTLLTYRDEHKQSAHTPQNGLEVWNIYTFPSTEASSFMCLQPRWWRMIAHSDLTAP